MKLNHLDLQVADVAPDGYAVEVSCRRARA